MSDEHLLINPNRDDDKDIELEGESTGQVRDFKKDKMAGIMHDTVNALLLRYVEHDRLQRGYNYKGSVSVDKILHIIICKITAVELGKTEAEKPLKFAKVVRVRQTNLDGKSDARCLGFIFSEVQNALDEFAEQLPII